MAKARVAGPPWPVWAAAAVVLAVALLIDALLAAGQHVPVLGHALEQALGQKAVAAALAALAAILLAGCIRRARLRHLATLPGGIEVADLEVSSSVQGVDAKRLSLDLRRRMADLHLASAGPQPGIAPPTDFIDLVSSIDGKGISGAVAGLLRAAWPTNAYRMQATLVQRTGPQPYGVSVQVLMLPSSAMLPDTCWADTWDDAIARASNFAASYIIPRSRIGRGVPWGKWHGFALPPSLLDDFERAGSLARERRYDEALGFYYHALKQDPKNLHIRLRLGYIQEKLGYALGALATYEAMCKLDERGALATVEVVRLAKYRRAVLLGAADRVVEQWTQADATPATFWDQRRAQIRELVRPAIRELLEKCYEPRARSLADLLSDGDREAKAQELREAFRTAAVSALAGLARELPTRDGRGVDDTTLTALAVRLSEACVRVRLEDAPLEGDLVGQASARLAGAGWDGSAHATWAERYNVASLYSLVIAGAGEDADLGEVARLAVEALEHAVLEADSGYVASRREWLTSEDPDLDALRSRPGAREWFDRFEAAFLPTGRPVCRRPPRVYEWEARHYVRRLLLDCADRRCALWRAPEPASERWIEEEAELWTAIAKVASDCHEWTARLDLVHALSAAAREHGWAPPRLAYPSYAELPPVVGKIDDALAIADRQLLGVARLAAEACAAPGEDAATRSDAWKRLVTELTTTVEQTAPVAAGNGVHA